MTDFQKPSAKATAQAKAYTAPRLQIYGGMTSLTAGGSGTVNEAMVGGMNTTKIKL